MFSLFNVDVSTTIFRHIQLSLFLLAFHVQLNVTKYLGIGLQIFISMLSFSGARPPTSSLRFARIQRPHQTWRFGTNEKRYWTVSFNGAWGAARSHEKGVGWVLVSIWTVPPRERSISLLEWYSETSWKCGTLTSTFSIFSLHYFKYPSVGN